MLACNSGYIRSCQWCIKLPPFCVAFSSYQGKSQGPPIVGPPPIQASHTILRRISLEVWEGESGSHSPEPRLLASLEEHGWSEELVSFSTAGAQPKQMQRKWWRKDGEEVEAEFLNWGGFHLPQKILEIYQCQPWVCFVVVYIGSIPLDSLDSTNIIY